MNTDSGDVAACLVEQAARLVWQDRDGCNPFVEDDYEKCGSAGSLASRRPGPGGIVKLTLTPPPGP